MTTKPKPTTSAAAPTPDGIETAEPLGTIRLKLAPLGIDHRADDFPTRFIEFCEQNDLYEMEVNAAGELLILPMTGFRGNRQETYLNYFVTHWQLPNGGIGASQSSRFHLPSGDIRGPARLPSSRKPSSKARRLSWWKFDPVPTTSAQCRTRCNCGWPAAPASAG
jgi:hypothetical protein